MDTQPTLVKHALELGATSSDKFTDRVTHLVAAEHGSAKYLVGELLKSVDPSLTTFSSAQ